MPDRQVWRIATDTPSYLAEDMTGKGAETTGGRWNSVGVPIVYATTTIALACLETVVHLNASGLPLNRYLVEISIPEDVWNAAQSYDARSVPVGWDAEPAGMVSIAAGDSWARAASSALLLVPSVIVPEEVNVLINPRHPDARRVTARKVRKWLFDPRLASR